MAQLRLEPPEPFNFRMPDDWPRWKKRFEQFNVASGLSKDDSAKQAQTLLYCMGEESESVLSSTDIKDDERSVYRTVMEKLDAFFKVRRNVIFERARFNRRIQQPGETAEQYIMEMYRLVESCEYGAMKDEMIRDRLVVGIRDTQLSQQLQLDAGLTLETAKKKIRQREAVGQQQKELKDGSTESMRVEEVRHERTFRPRKTSHYKSQWKSRNQEQKRCSRCGKGPHSKEKCPARDVTCYRCNKKGHYGAQCFSKEKVAAIKSEESTLDTAFLDTLDEKNTTSWQVDIEVNKQKLQFKLDTGAEVTAINERTYEKLRRKCKLSKVQKALYGPSKQQLEVLGQLQAELSHKSKTAVQPIYVVKGLQSNLLGLPAIRALDLVARLDTAETTLTSATNVMEKFPSVFTGLGNLGEEYDIKLKPGAVPFALYTPRQVPLPLRRKVREELDRMETLGVISKVDQPTTWCAGMVVVPKKEGNIRICVDLKPLNQSICREVFPLPMVDEILGQLAGAKVFSKLDANSGFWQIPLSQKSRPLTTFITPFGRYSFNKLPFGISSAPEHFQRRMSQILAGLEGVVCLIDDVLIFGKDKTEHDERLHQALTRIEKAGVTLNPNKCEFEKKQLKFLGHVVDKDGIKADPDKTEAIARMEPPKNVSELRRFMGMVNQLGKFSRNLADLTPPLRDLLSKKSVWTWDSAQDEAFAKVKAELLKPTVLALYDPQKPSKVSADASSFGLGAVLLQKCESVWKPIAYASRSMTETEKRYAQIEKEALATTWACEKFSTYILGKHFEIETDHKPLVPLLGTKQLNSLPPRILRFRLRLDRFSYSISHVPGKNLYAADTLSRAPRKECHNDTILEDETEALMELCKDNLPASAKTLEEYRTSQSKDPVCTKVIDLCKRGWPERNQLETHLRPYWKVRGELTVSKDGLLMYNKRMVVPRELQRRTLEKIHSGHQGIQKCRALVSVSVWWPGISHEIENMVKSCLTCAKNARPRREPMMPTELPTYPWQKVGTDLFQLKGKTYLVVVDYFSRFPEVQALSKIDSESVIVALKTIFTRFGIPEVVVSDNGPQYSSKEFSEFASYYGFSHITSSPYHPQSNGQAERTVQTIKKILKESEDPHYALLNYRSTPFSWCSLSPAELLLGRRIRSSLPLTVENLIPDWKFLEDFREKNKVYKEKQTKIYNRYHGVRPLSEVPLNTDVWVTSGSQAGERGTVIDQQNARSYLVETPTGTTRRNRHHLNIVPTQGDINGSQDTPRQASNTIMTRSRTGTSIMPPDRFC